MTNLVNLEIYKNDKNIEIKNAHANVFESYYKDGFYDDRQYSSFVKKVTRLARMSPEYDNYLYHLREEEGIDSCFVLSNVDLASAEIEMHHYPFTIYDIANAVIQKRLKQKQAVSSLLCAKEVMELHYIHCIGLVPTSITVHELAHAGEIFIPLTAVFGDIQKFVETYEPYISPLLLDKYNHLVEKTENNDPVDFNNQLVVKPIKWAVKEDEYDGNFL